MNTEFNFINLDFNGHVTNKIELTKYHNSNLQRVRKTFEPKNKEAFNKRKEHESNQNDLHLFQNNFVLNTFDAKKREKSKEKKNHIDDCINLIIIPSKLKNYNQRPNTFNKNCATKINKMSNNKNTKLKQNQQKGQINMMKNQLSNNELKNMFRKNFVNIVQNSYLSFIPSKANINNYVNENIKSTKNLECNKQIQREHYLSPIATVKQKFPKINMIHLRTKTNFFPNQNIIEDSIIHMNKSKEKYHQYIKGAKPQENGLNILNTYDQKPSLYSNQVHGHTQNNLLIMKNKENVNKLEIKNGNKNASKNQKYKNISNK